MDSSASRGTDVDKAAIVSAFDDMTPTQQCLTLSRQIGGIVASIDDVLLLLCSKRVTLEEKMIAAYFHDLTVKFASLLERLHHKLSESINEDSGLPAQEVRTQLFDVNTRIKDTVDELLKIARYNFNFLEQYFEYDYLESLTQKHKFKEALESLSKQFS